MPKPLFTDLHCHPSLKPYGHSIDHQSKNSPNTSRKNSIWHRKNDGRIRRFINRSLTLTRFTQSDFKNLSDSGTRLIVASLAPLECGFFLPKERDGIVTDVLCTFITGVGKKRIDFIQSNTDYYNELVLERDFFRQLHNLGPSGKYNDCTYRLVKNYNEIKENLREEKVVSVLLSIEGYHAFLQDNSKPPLELQLMPQVEAVCSWEFKPLFIAPAHHFNNYLCGHAYSLSEWLRTKINQKEGANADLTLLGNKVIRKLMDRGIYVDIKHMSRKARRSFYKIHTESQYSKLPIIASHAAVNGYPSLNREGKLEKENGKFFGEDINIFDDELLEIAKSGGLFGIQLDERRIASRRESKKVKWYMSRKKKLGLRAGMIWNQIEYIALVLDSAGLKAFDIQCVGSDNDGIVDPLDGFWTSKEFGSMRIQLKQVITPQLVNIHSQLQLPENKISAEEIVNKVFSENMLNFLAVYFTGKR